MRHPFLRTLAGSAATPTDPNFENVTLLLHGDGTNGGQNNTFVDGSTNAFSITRNGNTTQGTFSPYGSNWSNYFDGTGDYLGIASTTSLNLSSGDWTVECWWFPTSNTAQNPVMINYNAGTDGYAHARIAATVSPNAFYGLSSTNGTSWISTTRGGSWAVGNWYHLAYVRQGSTFTLFVNGVSVLSYSNASNLFASNGISEIGRTSSSISNFAYVNGYISNVRVVKGSAVYTSAFTPPTGPLTAITNTSLLTCQSNRFRDASTNNFTITRNGDVSVQRFSPFSPTAAYAAGTIGGSGYFDGTGDYLSVAGSTAFNSTGDFTMEAWIYLNARSAYGGIISFSDSSLANGGRITILNTGYLEYAIGNVFYTSTLAPLSEWAHVAMVRSGSASNNVSCYLNGTRVGQFTSTAQVNRASNVCVIGRYYADGTNQYWINGYISDPRYVVGTAVYSGTTITVPSAPLTAITNTSLLLNFTNAAILDNAMMAVPETVGNAQIDTTTKKYGTGSMKFDGTGDYLVVNSTTDLYAFGSGAFTIEFWLYLNSTQTSNLIDFRPSGTEGAYPTIYVQSNVLKYFTGTGDRIIGSTLSNSVWYHIALCKSGTSTKLFIDGTQTGSTYTDTATYLGSAGRPYIGGSSRNVNTNIVNGYIDDLRITKGVARYTSNFTPPTAALPDL